MADNATAPATTCTRCKRAQANAEELQHCDKCQAAYCSTDCLKADKKKHQKHCRRRAEGESNPSPNDSSAAGGGSNIKGLEAPIDRPFTRLDRGTYLHDRPRRDVFRLLIDCYRLRVEDDFNIDGIPRPASPHRGFQQFLGLAAQRPMFLPPWWDDAAAAECKAFGADAGAGWYSLDRRAGKQEVNAHYGSRFMSMELRLLGEVVYQRGPGGQGGKGIIEAMAAQEAGGMFTSIFGI